MQMQTQSPAVPIKSDRQTGNSSNVALNQTIKLTRKKSISNTGGCALILGQVNLQHTGERECLLKNSSWLSNVLVKKYYGW